jgi:short-subunit dehydrogenase
MFAKMRKTLVSLTLAGLGLAAIVRALRPRANVAGKNVVVTGGGRGLGLQIAREAAKRGARVGLCSRSEAELGSARAELEANGAFVATTVCDVRDQASVDRAFAELSTRLGPIDVLFNVAGVIGVGPIEALKPSDFYDAMDTNFFGALRATYAVLPAMRARRSGSIVNITSLGGAISIPHMLPYCASKFALLGFSQGLAAEAALAGVRVTTVIPGLMRTGSPPHATFAGRPRKEYALFALSDATPLTSVSVAHAAKVIVDGCERGAQRVIISWQAKFAMLANGLLPRLVLRVLTLAGFVLPDAGERPEVRSGFESESWLTRSPLNAMSNHASVSQNETIDPNSK